MESDHHEKKAAEDGKVREVEKHLADHQEDAREVEFSTDIKDRSEGNEEEGFRELLHNHRMDKTNTIRYLESYPQRHTRGLEIRRYLEDYP